MNQERYWRNLLADEIKAEHDKVKKYYQKKGMNSGGMSNEEHTRLNIFLLCESIARTMRNSQEYISTPDSTPEPIEQPVKEEVIINNNEVDGQISMEDIVIRDTVPVVTDVVEDVVEDPIQNLVKDTPYQNEFGEIL